MIKIKSTTLICILIPALAISCGMINVFIQYYLHNGIIPTALPPWYAFWELRSGLVGGLIFYILMWLIFFIISCFLEKYKIIVVTYPEIKDKIN